MNEDGNLPDTLINEEGVHYHLSLFIAGTSPASVRAINNLQVILEEYLSGMYELEIVDVRQQPLLAIKENITAIPVLIKKDPLPKRLLVGDMSDTYRVKRGLGLL